MTSETLISKYEGAGLAASRPATPAVPAGGAASYYATDTGKFSVWDGSAWHDFTNQGRTPPTLVQSKSVALAGSITCVMGAAPTNGNLLIAIVFGNGFAVSQSLISANWALVGQVTAGSGGDSGYCFIKWPGAGESTTQAPYGSSVTGGLVIFEYSNAIGVNNFNQDNGQTGTAIAASVVAKAPQVEVCGVFEGLSAALPTSITNATALTTSAGSRAQAPWHASIAAAGTLTVTGNYSGSSTVSTRWVTVLGGP